ncbi:Replication factor C subunit like, partial [Actinidia chinensis var. chinensis]
MHSDGEETSARLELLGMVKKHSKLLGKTIVDKEDAADVEMDSHIWRDVMDLYFVLGRESRDRQGDDLVFFVRKLILQGYGSSDHMEGNSPYFVRRWAPKVVKTVYASPSHVDFHNKGKFLKQHLHIQIYVLQLMTLIPLLMQ